MKQPRKNLAAFSAIIGFILLILAVAVLAEKSHEGHLPERNDRGTTSAPAVAGILAGSLVLLMAVPGTSDSRSGPKAISHRNTGMVMSCCPIMP